MPVLVQIDFPFQSPWGTDMSATMQGLAESKRPTRRQNHVLFARIRVSGHAGREHEAGTGWRASSDDNPSERPMWIGQGMSKRTGEVCTTTSHCWKVMSSTSFSNLNFAR
jgi:hypothetical protein